MSTFFGLNIALSSLYAQRRGLEVTGQNIANVNTEGYSRQRVGMEGVGGNTVPAIHSKWEGGGAGVSITDTARLRDQFLEARALKEHAVDSGLRQSQQVLARVELAFAEPSDSGLQAQLSDFWAGWGDVANNPTDMAARSQILERSNTLAASFNRARNDMGSLWESTVEQLSVTVAEANVTAARISELNGAIARATKAGLSPNDLSDQRDLLALDLAKSMGAVIRPAEDGMVDVVIGGTALVRGTRSETLQVHIPDTATVHNADVQKVQVQWTKDGYPATVDTGSAGAQLNAINVDLPRYHDGIDEIAQNLVTTVNAQLGQGYDAAGDVGGPLLNWDAEKGIEVIISDPAKLAAASEAPDAGPPISPSVDGRNALDLAALADTEEGPDAAYRSYIVSMGVETQTANRRVDIQADITNQVDAARDSQSGVNLDEEMANMVAYQHAYSAAARHLTAVDEMLATLMGTGIVGR